MRRLRIEISRAKLRLGTIESKIRGHMETLASLRSKVGPLEARIQKKEAELYALRDNHCPECEDERLGRHVHGNQEAHTCVQREMERAHDWE